MLVMVVALFEWDHLTTRSNIRFVVSAMTLLVMGALVYLASMQILPNSLPDLLPVIVLLVGALWLLQLRTLARGIDYRRSLKLELGYGVLMLLGAWAGMVMLRHAEPNGPYIVLLAMMVVWAADTFAYFAGKNFGRNKLAASISPGKTIEGVIGGMLGATFFAWISATVLLEFAGRQMLVWLLAAAAAAAISVVGDLYISRLKRQVGAKDSGKLIPGHGGILDRIDGLIAAMPVFASVWWLLS